ARRRGGTGPRWRSGRSRLSALAELLGLRALGGWARIQLGLHLRELVVDLARGRELGELAVDVVLARPEGGEVVERPGGLELGHSVGPRAHLLGLVLGALHGQADVGHLLADPGRRLGDAPLRLRRAVLSLADILLRATCRD